MAGIEKVCEYSGEYPGSDMYLYKKNSLQIMPKYRKLFAGREHTLYIEDQGVDPYFKTRHYLFCLYVPSLPGRVEGCYYNYTSCIGTVKRKLKRMLRCKSLNIIRAANIEDILDGLSNTEGF
jgi:hypothetical protein